jgi:hypothetical protein
MIKITRWWWSKNPVDLKFDVEIVRKRPRIDYRISEYVFEYVNKNILLPYKLMKVENYMVFLALDTFDIKRHNYLPYISSYNTNTTKISTEFIDCKADNGKEYVTIHIQCNSLEFNEYIKPIDYANIVYDMFSDCLVRGFRKKNKDIKEIADNHRKGMDYTFIEKFEYPASFENQKYLYDTDEGYERVSTDGVSIFWERPIDIPKNMEIEYNGQVKITK